MTVFALKNPQITSQPLQNTLMVGVLFAVLSNVLFGALYAYGKWLTPLTGTDVFCGVW